MVTCTLSTPLRKASLTSSGRGTRGRNHALAHSFQMCDAVNDLYLVVDPNEIVHVQRVCILGLDVSSKSLW